MRKEAESSEHWAFFLHFVGAPFFFGFSKVGDGKRKRLGIFDG